MLSCLVFSRRMDVGVSYLLFDMILITEFWRTCIFLMSSLVVMVLFLLSSSSIVPGRPQIPPKTVRQYICLLVYTPLTICRNFLSGMNFLNLLRTPILLESSFSSPGFSSSPYKWFFQLQELFTRIPSKISLEDSFFISPFKTTDFKFSSRFAALFARVVIRYFCLLTTRYLRTKK